MTTQRDLDTAAEVSLKICDKCGWYDGFTHSERCDPAAGKVASLLINAVPNVSAGQLGYGDGNVVFDISDGFSIVFKCDRQSFSVRDIHLLGALSVEDSAELVRVLKGWADSVGLTSDE